MKLEYFLDFYEMVVRRVLIRGIDLSKVAFKSNSFIMEV